MLKGSIVALVTPMLDNGKVDNAALRRLIQWHIEAHSDAIVVVGSTGESATLTIDEHLAVIQLAVEEAAKRIPIIAGTGANSTREAIYLSMQAKHLGAAMALSVVPYYNRPSQRGIYEHFQAIAQSVDLPMIIYNVPARTACDMNNDTVLRLAQIPNIVGLKDATADISRTVALSRQTPEHFALYSGDDSTALAHLLMGGHGVISVTANIAPTLMREMCRHALQHNVIAARTINTRLSMLHQRLFVESNPIPVKWALSRLGLVTNNLRLPLMPLSDEHHAGVLEAMHHANIILPS